MPACIHNVTFDAREPRLLGRFWSQVTGYEVVDEREPLDEDALAELEAELAAEEAADEGDADEGDATGRTEASGNGRRKPSS